MIVMSMLLLSVSTVFAQSDREISIAYYDNMSYLASENLQLSQLDNVTRVAPVAVAVFVAGILVGYVIDGIFIYATGHSISELTASAIAKIVKFVKAHPTYTYVTCSISGGGMGGGGGGGWK